MWIVVGAAVVVVVSVCAAIIALNMGQDPPTESVAPTTSSTTSSTTEVPGTGPDGTTSTVPPRVDEAEHRIQVGSRERAYLTVTPQGDAGAPWPVVVVMHGLGVDARAMSRTADWRGAVEEHRFMAVFPQGELSSWNMGPCCPPANLMQVDDRAFLDAMLEQLRGDADVDADRLYMTGFSNGALMVYDYACARPGVFRAIAPIAGSNVNGCFPDAPVDLLHQHSDPDPVVPYDGRATLGGLLSSAPFPDVPRSIARWAESAGCAAEPVSSTDADDVETMRWPDCRAGAIVDLVRIPGRAHNWPNKGDYDPLARMLEFFDLR